MNGYSSRIGILACTLGLMATALASAPEVAAQRAGPGGWGAARTLNVENLMRLAGELELTGEQRDQLESIRVELLEMRTTQAVQQMTLMSEVRAGIRERVAVRAEMVAFMETARETLGGVRERMQEILTEEQRGELRQLTRRAVWGNRGTWGRGGAWRDRGGADRERLERTRGSWRRGDFDRGRGRGDWRNRGRDGRGGEPALRG